MNWDQNAGQVQRWVSYEHSVCLHTSVTSRLVWSHRRWLHVVKCNCL